MKDYLELVHRFETVARSHFSTTTRITDLCRVAGIPTRTLSRAFQKVHAKTPHRYLEELRLNEARRALSSDADAATITEIATRFGFRELGRFASLYRKHFDESPSETKRHSCPHHEP